MIQPEDERVAAIVGGSGGIGMATARLLLLQGVRHVVLIGRNEQRGSQAATALGPHASFCSADANDADSACRAVAQIGATYGRLDALVVATAGGALPRPFADTPTSEIVHNLAQQATAPMIMSSAVLPLMRTTPGGSIVLIASDAAKVPTPGEAIIGAAMAAIVTFARTLAIEAKRYGIRVNAVPPSLVVGTALYDRLMEDEFSARLFAKARSAANLGVTTAEDVAGLIAFLCSASASRITGQAISINGGISAA